MKQWQLTLGLVVASLLVIFGFVGLAFGFNLAEFTLNAGIYLIVVVGILMTLPAVIGFAIPYWGIGWLDKMFDQDSNLGYWHILPGTAISLVIGFVWMHWIVPLCSHISILNTWPVEFLRFPVIYETPAWGWFGVVLILTGIGYIIGAVSFETNN
jgi:hypothetical protein